jgi:type VI protein secretion system component VasK
MSLIGLLLLVVALLYFVPTVIAFNRDHQNTRGIFILNVLIGWTVLGWIACLVWAATAVEKPYNSDGGRIRITPDPRYEEDER